jgi:hypothetical protein
MTHFCAAQNQPRLKATTVDPDAITFSFVDITNLRSPTAGHVHGLEVRFLEPDHITLLGNAERWQGGVFVAEERGWTWHASGFESQLHWAMQCCRKNGTSGAKARAHLAVSGTSKLVPFPFVARGPSKLAPSPFVVDFASKLVPFLLSRGAHCVGDANEIKTWAILLTTCMRDRDFLDVPNLSSNSGTTARLNAQRQKRRTRVSAPHLRYPRSSARAFLASALVGLSFIAFSSCWRAREFWLDFS